MLFEKSMQITYASGVGFEIATVHPLFVFSAHALNGPNSDDFPNHPLRSSTLGKRFSPRFNDIAAISP